MDVMNPIPLVHIMSMRSAISSFLSFDSFGTAIVMVMVVVGLCLIVFLSVNLFHCFNVFHCDWTVPNLVALDNVLKILHHWCPNDVV